jgi:ATPase family associated with various cellular activities (AAA)
MTLEFKVFVRELKELLKSSKNQKLEQAIRYNDDDKRVTVPAAHFQKNELSKLEKILEARLAAAPSDKRVRDNRWTLNRIKAYFELHEGAVDDHTQVKTVEALTVALKRFLETSAPHRWVFEEGADKIALPYFVTDIEYTKRKRTRDDGVIPASVRVRLKAYRNGEKIEANARWSEDEYRPTTVSQALADEGLIVETPKAVESYLKSLDTYARYQSACGEQVYAVGDGYASGGDRWWSSWGTTPMVRNGEPTRVVLDPLTEEIDSNKGDDESRVYSTNFWQEVPDRNGLMMQKADVDEEDEFLDDDDKPLETVEVMLPLHPYLYVFDLDKHQWVRINATNLQPYPWDKDLVTKLILPDAQKNLLSILMSTTGQNVGDIVRGKMSGVIVLATGVPGVGKTLTAEVFSEHIEKPLYSVQCSQLGLDVTAIEGSLQQVLSRAARWGAVLLIDEADVYVRERGEDIQQNAIVGVFLRLLEYYRGVLFMTSNRDIIDDAILSRATAWVKYELPDDALLGQIWRVLSRQFKVKLSDAEVTQLVKQLPHISGRSVRNILKLAVLLKGSYAGVEDLLEMSKYQALEEKHHVQTVARVG